MSGQLIVSLTFFFIQGTTVDFTTKKVEVANALPLFIVDGDAWRRDVLALLNFDPEPSESLACILNQCNFFINGTAAGDSIPPLFEDVKIL